MIKQSMKTCLFKNSLLRYIQATSRFQKQVNFSKRLHEDKESHKRVRSKESAGSQNEMKSVLTLMTTGATQKMLNSETNID